jgi:hypothetical protein
MPSVTDSPVEYTTLRRGFNKDVATVLWKMALLHPSHDERKSSQAKVPSRNPDQGPREAIPTMIACDELNGD